MISANLLVVDRSPDSAEHINSLLRNAGINVHVIHADSPAAAKRILDNDDPVLAIHTGGEDEFCPLEELAGLAAANNVPLVLYTDVLENDSLPQSLENTACFVVHSGSGGPLEDTVRRLAGRAENERLFATRQTYFNELEHRYNLLLDSSRDPIAYIHEGLHVYANRAYLEALHLDSTDQTMALSLLELIEPKSEEQNLKALLKELGRGVFPKTAPEVQVNRPDGSSFEATIHFSPARFDGEDCTQLMIQRKDEAAELASELERLRSTDPVTRMANRKAFMEAVESWVSSDSQEAAAAVLYIEPDGFEALQEDMDDSALEAYLCSFADVIRYSLEGRDLPARIGDGGFAVLARRPVASDMESLADTILQNCRGHVFEMEERSISSTCSIGACQINRLMKEPRAILSHAKQVQSKAAAAGDCCEFFRPQLTAVESPEGETEWVERIRRALGNNDFYVVQQPIVDLDGEGGKLMENIPYMRGEEGDYAFSRFRVAAEHNDLGESIDREVIPNLLRNLVESDEPQILNLSENSIMDYGFQEWFVAQIRGAPVEGNRIIVQVAAGAAHDNLRPVQALMQSLAPQGCRLSLCDFRGDPKARQLLEHLDVSHIKLHHSLIADLATDSSKPEAIKKIVGAAREHGADVIAENVADTTGLAVLWQCGVKLISGAFLEESSQVVAS